MGMVVVELESEVKEERVAVEEVGSAVRLVATVAKTLGAGVDWVMGLVRVKVRGEVVVVLVDSDEDVESVETVLVEIVAVSVALVDVVAVCVVLARLAASL